VQMHGEIPRVIVLCRMLFTARPGSEFRRPRLGVSSFGRFGFPGQTEDWLLEPIALVDGVPFLIVNGYQVAGLQEPGPAYLHYCFAECDWSDYRFRPKSQADKAQALETIRKRSGTLSGWEMDFLTDQIK